MSDAIDWYERNAEAVSDRYENHNSELLHSWLKNLLPPAPAMILDVGAGTGRDAAWLAAMGHKVTAVEPTGAMREAARKIHPDASICWFPDKLPDLQKITRSGLSFDFILLSAVWMHVAKEDREKAFRQLVGLLKPGGVIAITLRMGPIDKDRGIHQVSSDELRQLAKKFTLIEEYYGDCADHSGRDDIHWINFAFRALEDGTGALPLLRHVILKEAKSSTYKLALLRALCRAADSSAGLSSETSDDEYSSVPLGLVALNWIRLFTPLLKAELPQSPENIGFEKLRFAKQPFRRLLEESELSIRVGGMSFTGEIGRALHGALKDAAKTIQEMPATYMTHPNGDPILPIPPRPQLYRPDQIHLDYEYLSSFGEIHVPSNLWRAMQRFDVWIEPALVAEWSRLIKGYAEKQERKISEGKIAAAMVWDEPTRDVTLAKRRALSLLRKRNLECVWTGKPLTEKMLDMDHCFPWSAWPCGDLWNLMPAHRNVNQHQKRALLPSERTLVGAQQRILDWWNNAYTTAPDTLSNRFWIEARSSLPGRMNNDKYLPDVFGALLQQRLRLSLDQQIPEWEVAG